VVCRTATDVRVRVQVSFREPNRIFADEAGETGMVVARPVVLQPGSVVLAAGAVQGVARSTKTVYILSRIFRIDSSSFWDSERIPLGALRFGPSDSTEEKCSLAFNSSAFDHFPSPS